MTGKSREDRTPSREKEGHRARTTESAPRAHREWFEPTEAVFAQTGNVFEKIFSTAYVAITWLDRDLRRIRVNPAYAQMYGEMPGFFLDKPYFEVRPDDDLKSAFERVLTTGEPYVAFARPFVMMNGAVETLTWWDWNLSTQVDPQGRAEGLLLCLVDPSNA